MIDLIVKDCCWLGFASVIFKADNKKAIRVLLARVVDRAAATILFLEQISVESAAKYDSQSNGLTEVGVALVRGMFRILKLCLEARIERYIPVDHAIVPWLLEHASLIFNTSGIGPDGLTAWARARGRGFNQPMLGFGEQVLYKLASK